VIGDQCQHDGGLFVGVEVGPVYGRHDGVPCANDQRQKIGWDVDMLGQAASYDTAVATAPGATGEGFYSMTPTLYVYPDDPRPDIRDLMARYRGKYGIDMNYIGQTGVSVAEMHWRRFSERGGT
jgi:hypothetical protein